jgi:BlaI family penicillinase repressor
MSVASTSATTGKMPSPRRSVLDLAPLELDCMNTLWPMGEGTVREIRDGLSARRARAYTTIMTIMDRLARKGVVERRKAGRAYVYRPNLTAQEARAQALGQVVENFFGGSKEALVAQLNGQLPPARLDPVYAAPPKARAAAASASTAMPGGASAARRTARTREAGTAKDDVDSVERIDDTLL